MKATHLNVALLLSMALSLPGLSAHAGRPLATEDAGVLAKGDCEWESVGARLNAHGQAPVSAWSTQVACGVMAGTQLAVGYGHTQSIDVHDQALTFSGKSAWIDGGDQSTSVSLAYGVNMLRALDASFQLDSISVNLAASRPLPGEFTAHANLGLVRTLSDKLWFVTWNLAMEHPLTQGVDLGLEVYGDHRSQPMVGMGLRWALNEHVQVNASEASQAGGDHARLFSLGTNITF